jgi:acyltransferase
MTASSRVVFVDLLRFVAALQMLQGHTIAALLAPEYRHGVVYALWSTARGLTSVAFLFAAGLSFYLATERPVATATGRRRRVLRALRLIAIGYLLHFPVGVVSSSPATRVRALHELAAVDVLQCIGVSVLLLEALRTLFSSTRARVLAALAMAVGLFALAPLAGQLSATGPLRPVLAYLTPSGGSLFPLTPWAAHVFAGFACGAVVRMGAAAPGTSPLGSLGVRLGSIAGLVTLVAVALLACAAPRVLADHLSRLAGVLAMVWMLWFAGERLKAVPASVAILAQHTLLLYVFHVLLVYGQGVGLGVWIGPRVGPGWAVIAAVFVIGASSAVALGYDRLARARRTG